MNKAKIEDLFRQVMLEMGLDLSDDSLEGTPARIAKMYANEIFYGLDPDNFPKITTVENKFSYDQMLIESDITVNSMCEHHFLPIIGFAHISYIPDRKVLGLSKFNRIVDYFSRRPQIQERLTNDIHKSLTDILETDNVAVVIDGVHTCVKLRGIKDQHTVTRTSGLSGVFRNNMNARAEFFASIPKQRKAI